MIMIPLWGLCLGAGLCVLLGGLLAILAIGRVLNRPL